MKKELGIKYENLKLSLKNMKKVMVAFSAGVDSTFLLKAARDSLGREGVLAVTASSKIRFEEDLENAKKFAGRMDVELRVVESDEMKDPGFVKNDKLRCYHCKRLLFSDLRNLAEKEGIEWIVDGTNYDDVKNDYRPGLVALGELKISSPLKDAGLTKAEIRLLSEELSLPTWNMPPETCLATRFPYGIEITPERLEKLESVEKCLRSLDLTLHRARYQDDNTIRIEVLPKDMEEIMKNREMIVETAKKAGFKYTALDLEGYRSGSLNEVLKN